MANSVIVKIDGDDSGFKKSMSGIGKTATKGLKVLGNGATATFKGIAVGATAAITAVGAIGVAAVKSYAEFEQLSGGAKKIFDEIDYAKIKKDADEAFKTMQISANQYLQLMTTVGANFASTLGDEKGYEVAKQGMKAITDFATGTGRDIDELSQKYQMITKSTSSYQSIADQFAGILPATSADFLEQAQAAGVLSDSYTKLTDVPMAEYQEAVTQMLTKGVDALGLTDNAANEATTTLSGSMNMLKASWENLMTGLADPSQDLDVLIDNVINSATALLENLMPIIESVLESMPVMINTLGTKLLQELPGLVNQLLPALADTASQLVGTLAQSLSDNADSIGQTALSILMTLINTFLNNLPTLIETALTLLITLAEGITQALPTLIPTVVDTLMTIVDTLLDNIDILVDTAIELIMALADGLIEGLPIMAEKVPEIVIKLVKAIIDNAPKIKEASNELIAKLWDGLINAYKTYFTAWGSVIYNYIILPIKNKLQEIIQVGKNIAEGLLNGITNAKDWLIGKIKDWCGNILDAIKAFFGIKSPSRVMRDEVGKMITKGIAVGIDDGKTEVEKVMDSLNEELLESEKKYLNESQRLKDSKSEADKKYLEELKENADKERKIYDALQKDIENEKEAIVKNFEDITDAAFDSLEELEDLQTNISDKLKGYGELYETYELPSITLSNGQEITPTKAVLTDLSAQNEELEKYYEMLMKVKERGNIPKELFVKLRDMSVEDGMSFASALLEADDETFEKYISGFAERGTLSENIAKALTADESNAIEKAFEEQFGQIPEDFFGIGKESAEKYGEGFMGQLQTVLANVKQTIQTTLSSMIPSNTFAFVGGAAGTTNNYSSTINLTVPQGASEQGYIQTMRDYNTRNQMSGGY